MYETRYPREGQANNWVWAVVVQPSQAVFSVLSGAGGLAQTLLRLV